MKRIAFLLACSILTIMGFAQKTVYIPNDFNSSWADNYCNKYGVNGTITSIDGMKDNNERFSKLRSYQTDNIVCFWEAGFGTDPTKMVNPANTGSTFNLTTYMAKAEEIFTHHYKTLQATYQNGKNITKYKFIFCLYYTTDWMAYGGGYDYVIGAMWLNPAALGVGSYAPYPYFTLAHELFHSMSYQVYSDRPDNTRDGFQTNLNGPFWERSANYAAAQMYPNVDNDPARYFYATNSHFLNSRKHYTTSFELEALRDLKGAMAFGQLWQENLKAEHPLMTASRLFFNNDMSQLNDFIGKTAMKMVTFDFAAGSNGAYLKTVCNNANANTDGASYVDEWGLIIKRSRTILRAIDYNKRHFAVQDCQAPQDFGYNIIRLYPETTNADGSADIKMRFRGHTYGDQYKNAGWRWGFVAIQSDGTPRYGTLYSDTSRTVTFTKAATDKEVWLVVAGTPSAFNTKHQYTWEAGFPKYYRYPYEVRFQNAVPNGYQADYEGAKSSGKAHSNGGGWVASTATVASTAYVGPNAKVLGTAKVSGNARIEDFAIVKGSAQVYDNAVVRENAMVFSNAKVFGNAVVAGCSRVFNNCSISGDAFVTDNAFVCQTTMTGNAIACGNLWQRENTCTLSGTCVAGGDNEYAGCASVGTESSGTYLQWPENANNQRTRLDGKGNLSTTQLATLKSSWNNLTTRFNILNNSISTSSTNPNWDINYPYASYITDTEMSFGSTATYTLTATASGQGTVSPSTGTYAEGTSVTITATPASGYIFTGWSGDATGTTNPLTVTMDKNKTITASFAIAPTYTLTTSTTGQGTISPSSGSYSQGTSVTLTATAASGYVFSGWGGDATGTTNPLTLTMTSNKTISATFTAIKTDTLRYSLNMTVMTDYTASAITLDATKITAAFGMTAAQISAALGTTINYAAVNGDGTLNTKSTAIAPGHWFSITSEPIIYGADSYVYSELDLSKLVANVGQYPSRCTVGNSFVLKQILYSASARVVIIINVKIVKPTITQSISLKKGWNLISINVSPTDSTIATLFTGLDAQEVKDMNTYWRKGQADVFNGLKKITAGAGFLVNMNIAGTLTIAGTPVSFSNSQINTSSNWMLMGCPYQTATAISTVFNATNSSVIKNLDGFWTPTGGAANSIQNLEPGKGYFIKR